MITNKLKTIFGLSIPLFAAHGIEEFFTGFYKTDAWDMLIFGPFMSMDSHRTMFATFEIMLVLLLTISFLLILNDQWRVRLLAVLGFIYVFEIHHIVKAVQAWSYYPGFITALIFPVITFLFWREFWKNHRHQVW